MDYTLVLVGPQSKEKSTAVEALAVNPSWFHDTSVKVGTKDGMLARQGCWVMELAELASIKGAALEGVKAFLSSRTDRFRPPYGSTLDSFPRTTAFIKTTNEEQFLTDPTGNRRFCPVVVGDIDIEALKRDREQLWAEAVHRVKAGERHWPEDDEKARLDRYRARFVSDDPWVGPIVDWLDEQTEPFRIDEPMVDALGLAAREMKRSYNRVGAILRSLGYSKKKVRRGASSQRLWTRER